MITLRTPLPPRRLGAGLVGFAAVLMVLGCLGLGRWLTDSKSAPPPEMARRDLVLRNNCWYQPGQTNPFSGWIIESYPDGARLSRSAVVNGRLNGLSEGWYRTGQIQIREHYRDNLSDGLREKWYSDGHPMSQAFLRLGKLDGIFRHWRQNGQIAEEIQMKEGKPNGRARSFYPDGFLEAETQVRDGLVLVRHSHPDGEGKIQE